MSHPVQPMIDESELEVDSKKTVEVIVYTGGRERVIYVQDTQYWTRELNEIIRSDETNENDNLPVYRGTATEFLRALTARQRALDEMRRRHGDEVADDLALDYPVPSVRFDVLDDSWAYNPRRFLAVQEVLNDDRSAEEEEMEYEEEEEGLESVEEDDEFIDVERYTPDLPNIEEDDEPTCYLINEPMDANEEEFYYYY